MKVVWYGKGDKSLPPRQVMTTLVHEDGKSLDERSDETRSNKESERIKELVDLGTEGNFRKSERSAKSGHIL